MRAAGANENARYLCKCVGLQDGMKQNDEIDLAFKPFSVCLSTIGSNVSGCDFCGPRPPPLRRGDRQAGLRSDSDCKGLSGYFAFCNG